MKNTLYLFLTVLAISFALVYCTKEEKIAKDVEDIQAISAALPPCDSVYYIPIYSVDTLRVVKNSIKAWTFKGKRYWFALVYASGVVKPFNYQHDPNKERIVICDTFPITDTSLFYVTTKHFK